MKFENKTCLVTGGTGFVGSHLCEELLNEGANVIAFDNLYASTKKNIEHIKDFPRFEFVKGDVRNFRQVLKQVKKCDYVFHLAASNVGNSVIHPIMDAEVNSLGTLNVLMAVLLNRNVRMVHVSSGSVLGSGDKPMKEDFQLAPTTPYGISKMSGEKYAEYFAREFGLKISIIRYFHVFGPRQDMKGKCGVINIFLNKILMGGNPVVWGDGSQVKCFTYVKDSVNATMMLALDDRTIGEVYNCASDTIISIRELAELLVSKYAFSELQKPVFSQPKIGENMRPVPDVSKLKALGWKTNFTFDQGLDLAKDWVKENI